MGLFYAKKTNVLPSNQHNSAFFFQNVDASPLRDTRHHEHQENEKSTNCIAVFLIPQKYHT